MKKISLILILGILSNFRTYSQVMEAEVKSTINQLFEGMKGGDSIKVLAVFGESAYLESVGKDATGQTIIRKEDIRGFADFVGKQQPGDADERIQFETIKIDDDLAIAWTPYEFYYKGKFSHRGVNMFCLVRKKGLWKIQYLIDTRRK